MFNPYLCFFHRCYEVPGTRYLLFAIISLSLNYFSIFVQLLVEHLFRCCLPFFRSSFFADTKRFPSVSSVLILFSFIEFPPLFVIVRMRARSTHVWYGVVEGDARKAPLACSFSKASRRLTPFYEGFPIILSIFFDQLAQFELCLNFFGGLVAHFFFFGPFFRFRFFADS